MKTRNTVIALLGLISSVSSVNAATTVSFNAFFSGGMSSNLATAAGLVSNDLFYGIIVDSNRNGFLSSYNGVNLALGSEYNLTTTTAGVTDDYLFLALDKTSDSSQGGVFTEGDGTTPGGNGGVSGLSYNLLSTVNGIVGVGDPFMLVWFDSNAKNVGALSSAQFLVTAEGDVAVFDGPFVGTDPVRDANHTWTETSAQSVGAGITFIPETSTALLGALGALGLLRRRRI